MGFLSNSSQKQVPEKVQDLIDLYCEMVRTRRKIDSGSGDMTHERLRHDKLVCKVDPMWSTLSNPEQLLAVRALIKDGYMVQGMDVILTSFEGRIDMMPPPEPCIKI